MGSTRTPSLTITTPWKMQWNGKEYISRAIIVRASKPNIYHSYNSCSLRRNCDVVFALRFLRNKFDRKVQLLWSSERLKYPCMSKHGITFRQLDDVTMRQAPGKMGSHNWNIEVGEPPWGVCKRHQIHILLIVHLGSTLGRAAPDGEY